MRRMTGSLSSLFIAIVGVCLSPLALLGQSTDSAAVHMVVTLESTRDDTAPAQLNREDVFVKQAKNRLKVTDWIPARGNAAALQLFLLIDDTCDTALGSHLEDLRSFINAQPATTVVAVGYMRNSTVNIAQNFTPDHALAAKALRLPLASVGAQDSPYLSLIDLLKRWPASKVRREVLMVSDGIDRLRGYNTPSGRSRRYQTMPSISPDADSASDVSQRSGVIIHTIYSPGIGRANRNYYEAQTGVSGITKLSDETGGESFYLSLQNPVSFKPYMDRLQTILDNQYFLVFLAKPNNKGGLQRVQLDTEVPSVELVAADNVWVPGIADSSSKNKK